MIQANRKDALMNNTATPERTATVLWSDALSLDLDFMDETHREFIDLLAAIEVADDERVVACFAAMIEHTEGHFGEIGRAHV